MSGAVERLRKLDADGTPGPWQVDERHGLTVTDEAFSFADIEANGLNVAFLEGDAYEHGAFSEDAALIAESRNALGALLDAADVLDLIARRDPATSPHDRSCHYCGETLPPDHHESCLWRRARVALARLSGDREGADR